MVPVLKPRAAAAAINIYFGMQIYLKMRNRDGTSIPPGSGLAVVWLFKARLLSWSHILHIWAKFSFDLYVVYPQEQISPFNSVKIAAV